MPGEIHQGTLARFLERILGGISKAIPAGSSERILEGTSVEFPGGFSS